MSVVANVLVLASTTPRGVGERLEEGYRDEAGRLVMFANIAEYRGGDPVENPSRFWPGKVPECDVWASAPNHLHRDAMKAFLLDVWGKHADRVRVALYVNVGENDTFDVGTIEDVFG